jgi:TusA-related sulfurtransferase
MKEVEINGRKIKVSSVIDAVGLYCPMPIVHLKLELESLNSNQVAEVLADDPGFENDVITWCKETNNELLFLTKNEEDIFVAYVKKA